MHAFCKFCKCTPFVSSHIIDVVKKGENGPDFPLTFVRTTSVILRQSGGQKEHFPTNLQSCSLRPGYAPYFAQKCKTYILSSGV